jgi:hypothetical protein
MYTQDFESVILLGPHCSLVFSKRPRDIAAGFIWIQVAPLVTPPLARSDRPLFPSWSKGQMVSIPINFIVVSLLLSQPSYNTIPSGRHRLPTLSVGRCGVECPRFERGIRKFLTELHFWILISFLCCTY